MPLPPFYDSSGAYVDGYSPFVFSTEWREMGDEMEPGGEDAFSLESSRSMCSGIVGGKRLEALRRDALGYAWTDDDTMRLYRKNPVRHPRYHDLHCTGISVRRRGLSGNKSVEDPNNEGGNLPKITSTVPGTLPHTCHYEDATANLAFAQLPYTVREDVDMVYDSTQGEWFRNVDWQHEYAPDVSLLNATGPRGLKWAEGPLGPGSSSPNTPRSIPSPNIVEYVVKTKMSWKWYGVPEEYLFDNLTGEPGGIIWCLGKTNSTEFYGWELGTLLLLGVKLDKFQWPWVRMDGSSATVKVFPSFGYNVTLLLSYTNPEPGVVDPATPLAYGHNLYPLREENSIRTKWYLATLGGTASGDKLIQSANYSYIFSHVLTP
jgi:hypothetical protein